MEKEKQYAREFSKYPDSKVVKDWFENGIKIAIVACKGSYYTAYFGVPKDHPLAKVKSYDDLPLNVHGGLTYASGESKLLSNDFFWYGWDYAHAGDRTYFDNLPREFLEEKDGEHDWTLLEVETEVKDALYDFKKFVKLAELLK